MNDLKDVGLIVLGALVVVFLGMVVWGAYQLLCLITGFTDLSFFDKICIMAYAVSLIRISVSAKDK